MKCTRGSRDDIDSLLADPQTAAGSVHPVVRHVWGWVVNVLNQTYTECKEGQNDTHSATTYIQISLQPKFHFIFWTPTRVGRHSTEPFLLGSSNENNNSVEFQSPSLILETVSPQSLFDRITWWSRPVVLSFVGVSFFLSLVHGGSRVKSWQDRQEKWNFGYNVSTSLDIHRYWIIG